MNTHSPVKTCLRVKHDQESRHDVIHALSVADVCLEGREGDEGFSQLGQVWVILASVT